MNLPERVLVVSPHTDDAELGCGGLIARLVGRVNVLACSDVGKLDLRTEMDAAMRVLGVEAWHALHFPVRRFAEHRQEILELLLECKARMDPEWVLLPSANDMHQDHQVVHAEGLRAFKDRTILAYELPWNHLTFQTQGFVTLTGAHVDTKWDALACYASQSHRAYFRRTFVDGLARVRGTQIGEQFAEAFEIVRMRW